MRRYGMRHAFGYERLWNRANASRARSKINRSNVPRLASRTVCPNSAPTSKEFPPSSFNQNFPSLFGPDAGLCGYNEQALPLTMQGCVVLRCGNSVGHNSIPSFREANGSQATSSGRICFGMSVRRQRTDSWQCALCRNCLACYMIDRVDFQIPPLAQDGTASFVEPVMARPGLRRSTKPASNRANIQRRLVCVPVWLSYGGGGAHPGWSSNQSSGVRAAENDSQPTP